MERTIHKNTYFRNRYSLTVYRINNPCAPPLEHNFSSSPGARAGAEKKTGEARSESRAFIDAWKDADPGLKLLADAKREFAQLH
jgi:hypothetical protein